ncbi:MAG: PKD domain-containing protein [Lewinellaceae bacterium]|nr:PKD domain-containing protein [Lewinellaceae bacterium]
MKRINFLVLFSLFILNLSYSQDVFEREKRDYVWLVGSSPIVAGDNDITRFDFNSGQAVIESIDLDIKFRQTNSSISDISGNLLFYTNGLEVRNFNNDTLVTGLAPTQMSEQWSNFGYINPQGTLILPLPESDSLYYVFHEDRDWAPHGGSWVQNLFCTKVDMAANNNAGIVLEKNVSVINDTLAYGRIVATRHANGRDWWIVAPERDNNRYYSVLFTSNGIEEIKNFQIGDSIVTGGHQSSFSPDGTKYARIDIKYAGESEHRVTIYDFDRCAGEFNGFTSFTFVDWAFGGGGIAFSENGQFLYIVAWMNIYQYDLRGVDIEATRIKIAEYDGFVGTTFEQTTPFHNAQLAPTGKIYINCSTSANYFHIIHNPNQKGLACNVEQHALEIPTLNYQSIPNFPYYGLGPLDGSPCDTLGIDNPPPQAAFSYVIEDSAAFQVAFYDGTRFSPESWLWDFGEGQSSTERFPVHAYTEAGVYEVCLTASNQTGSDTFCDTVNFLATGVQEAISMPPGFSVFPNPASSRLAVRSGRPFAGQRLSLYSVMGREVLAHGLPEGATSFAFSVAGLPPGVYFVSIWEGAAAVWSERVVVGRR